MSITYKLTSRQHDLLCEALRRHTRFNMCNMKEPLTEAWLGLGTYTIYKLAITANLMTYVHEPHPGYIQWWKLTERGVAIVQQWLDEGYTFLDIDSGKRPPKS